MISIENKKNQRLTEPSCPFLSLEIFVPVYPLFSSNLQGLDHFSPRGIDPDRVSSREFFIELMHLDLMILEEGNGFAGREGLNSILFVQLCAV